MRKIITIIVILAIVAGLQAQVLSPRFKTVNVRDSIKLGAVWRSTWPSGGTAYADGGLRMDGDTVKLGNKDMYDKYGYTVLTVDTSFFIADTNFLGTNITIQNKPFASRSILISTPDSTGATSGLILLSPQVANIAIKQMDFKIDSLGTYNRYQSINVTSCDILGNFKATTLGLSATQDTTVTAILGRIVYKSSDNHFYGCRSLTGKKWYQLDN